MDQSLLTRVLLLTPTRRDGEITSSLLIGGGETCLVCENLFHLLDELKRGAGVVLITEEAISAPGIHELLQFLEAQPPWSDLPIVMLMKSGITSPTATKAIRDLRNVTLVERPAPTRSVVSAVQAAIRGRERQYQIRDQIEAIHEAQKDRDQLLESERAARQEAERAGRIKDEFLATLSHELRTPLNAIFGWSQLIKINPADETTVAEGVKVIDRNVRLQTQLIEDLLDVSRIISGKVRLEVQSVELPEVIGAALEAVKPAAMAKNITLENRWEGIGSSVQGDPGRLQQVFWNLLTNAIKFTPHSGTIRVRATCADSQLEVRVSDTGEGIDPAFLSQLFERFTQADASTTRKHGGLGLGLSIVRNLVEMHGGTVHGESQGTGQGATFVVRLPLTPAASAEQPVLTTQENSKLFRNGVKLTGLKILVVDDETDSRELVERILTEVGAQPTSAASAAEANVVLCHFEPNIIISDIGMPVEDGYAFMRALRGRGLKTPALALTAFARSEDRIRSIQAGYQMHLRKPVDPVELVAVVASMAGRFESVQQS
jgi:signal transduction histidine kinase/ActR/RegA family two-component response regulator